MRTEMHDTNNSSAICLVDFNLKGARMLEIINTLHIQSVGNGLINLICPPENICKFIDYCSELNITIKGFTWWCHIYEYEI